MANKGDQKAKRLIQGVIREAGIGQVIDNNLAAALAAKIVVALRTAKDGPTPRPKPRPAFMSVPSVGNDGKVETKVEKVNPTPVGSQPLQADEKKAFIKGDNVDRSDLVKEDDDSDLGTYEDLLGED